MITRERHLRDDECEERYERLVERSPDAILIHDGEFILEVNAATMRLAGALERSELVGKPVELVLHPPFLRAVAATLTGAKVSTDIAPAVPDVFHRLDGATVDVDVRAQLFVVGGRPSAHLVIRDVTERLAAEAVSRELLLRLQGAQRLDAVGALAGGVAHEVNNMMQVVLGFGALLMEEPSVSAAALEDVREILRAATHAATITRQLLEFSRHAPHEPQIIDLGVALRRLEPVLRRLVGVSRVLRLETDDAPIVRMDVGQLEQMLVNLILNARNATAVSGNIVVVAGSFEVGPDVLDFDGNVIPAGPYAALVVRDDGMGMDASTRARIFEPFFTTNNRGEGTGLGLSAVHGIVAQHGGFITVVSARGQGAIFTLLWPALSAEEAARAADPVAPIVEPSRAHGERILVVDDEPAVRAVTRRILERGGYEVIEAADAAEAIAMLNARGAPALVITDLTMPGMGGAEMGRQLRLWWPNLPMLFMSGHADMTLSPTMEMHRASARIQKPFTMSALLTKVDEMLRAAK